MWMFDETMNSYYETEKMISGRPPPLWDKMRYTLVDWRIFWMSNDIESNIKM